MYVTNTGAPALERAPLYDTIESLPIPRLSSAEILRVDDEGGHEALHKKLRAEVTTLDMKWEDELKVLSAAGLILDIHRGQKRSDGDGTAYGHVFRVYHKVAGLGVRSGSALCAALLHDSVEDFPDRVITLLSSGKIDVSAMSEAELRAGAVSLMAESYDYETATIVNLLSNPLHDDRRYPGDDGKQREYEDHLYTLLSPIVSGFVGQSERADAQIIKLADRWDNYVNNWRTRKPERQFKSYAKYIPQDSIVDQALRRTDNPHLSSDSRQLLRQEFMEGHIRARDSVAEYMQIEVQDRHRLISKVGDTILRIGVN